MEILKFVVFLSLLEKTLAVCIDHDKNEPACMADPERCFWCACTEICVPEKYGFGCDAGCVGFCGKTYHCAANGCIYDYKSLKCYDFVVNKGVDFEAICKDSNKDACISQGCYFCPCSKTCVPPNKALECDKGCYQYCGNVEDCATSGCIYDYNTNLCRPSNGKYRYSMNMCNDQPVTFNGIWYVKWDFSKVQVLQYDIVSQCYCNEGAVGSLPDKDLYKCTYESPDVNVRIPVKQGGKYIIGLHMAEVYHPVGRVQTFQLNGVTILNEFPIDSIGGLGRPYTFTKDFEINCDLNEATINGQKVPLVNNHLVLHMFVRRNPGGLIHAILNAYYLEKTDKKDILLVIAIG